MTVHDVAAQVVDMFTRAESLFAPADNDAAAAEAAGRLQDAVTSSSSIGQQTGEMSGGAVAGHREMAQDAAAGLESVAQSDGRLADQLAAAVERHTTGQAKAQQLRIAAGEVPDRFGELAETPAGELVALKTMRGYVVEMEQLIADHAGHATEVAEQIRALGYQR